MKGQTLFELVIALGVAVLILTGIVHVVTVSIRNSAFAKNQAEATRYAKEAQEWIRKERDKDWDTFIINSQLGVNFAVQTFCLKGNPLATWPAALQCGTSDNNKVVGTQFWREAEMDRADGTVSITVKVWWQDASGKHISQIGTRLTNWRVTQ